MILNYTANLMYSDYTNVSIPLAYLRSFGNGRLDLIT